MKTTADSSQRRLTKAFSVLDLLVLIGLLMLLATLLLPLLSSPKHSHVAQKINCLNNMKQIGLSFRTWALDNNDHFPMGLSVTNGGTMELIANVIVYWSFVRRPKTIPG